MRWRKSTWAVIAWTVVMLAWLVWSVAATASSCRATGGTPAECDTYTVIAAAVIGLIWLVGVLPLAGIWYATRARVVLRAARWGAQDDQPPVQAPRR
jgi:hypothetical protein